MRDWLTMIAVAVMLAAATCGMALAHGDASWIMLNPSTAHCCGPDDCAPVDDALVTQQGDGWVFEGKLYRPGDPNVHPSINGRFWACRFPSGEIRCFFYVPPGS